MFFPVLREVNNLFAMNSFELGRIESIIPNLTNSVHKTSVLPLLLQYFRVVPPQNDFLHFAPPETKTTFFPLSYNKRATRKYSRYNDDDIHTHFSSLQTWWGYSLLSLWEKAHENMFLLRLDSIFFVAFFPWRYRLPRLYTLGRLTFLKSVYTFSSYEVEQLLYFGSSCASLFNLQTNPHKIWGKVGQERKKDCKNKHGNGDKVFVVVFLSYKFSVT